MSTKNTVNPYTSAIPIGTSVNRNVTFENPQVVKIHWPNTSGGVRPPKPQGTGILNKIFG